MSLLYFWFAAIYFVIAEQQERKTVKQLIQMVFGNGDETFNESLLNLQPASRSPTSTAGPNGCTCVPYYLCNNGTINKDGVGIIDIRLKRENPCPDYLDQCCNTGAITKEPIKPYPEVHVGCGHRNANGIGMSITGAQDNEAQFGEFPWMVAILWVQKDNTNLKMYQCGGALIHPHVVLTAAHCVADKRRVYMVRAGEWDTQTTKEIFPHQDRHVSSVVIHPQFYEGALFNDVALLVVESPFTLMENVDVVCLPRQNSVIDSNQCYATGWGKDSFGKEGRYQVILKKIELPMVDRQTCQDRLRITRLGRMFELHHSFVCAGGLVGKDTCKGDGGSPLVCPIPGFPNKYQLAGIVAWGIGCGSHVPGVYVNVALFRDWIDEQMAFFNIDMKSYIHA